MLEEMQSRKGRGNKIRRCKGGKRGGCKKEVLQKEQEEVSRGGQRGGNRGRRRKMRSCWWRGERYTPLSIYLFIYLFIY